MPGPKHVVLVTAGWAIPERFAASIVEPVVAAASASHVMVHALLAERFVLSGAIGRASPRPSADRELVLASVELLADWTGGQSLRVVGRGDGVFVSLGQAFAGYYRLGVRPEASDLDGKVHRIAVKVSKPGARVRGHRRLVSAAMRAPVAHDDPVAALRSVVRSATVAVDFDLRVTTYVAGAGGTPPRARVSLAGDVAKATPGPARVMAVFYDDNGKPAATGERAVLVDDAGRAELSGTFPLAEGVYIARVAVRDSAGRFASVERTVETAFRTVRGFETHGLALFRAANAGERPEPLVDRLAAGEQLIAQVQIRSDASLRPESQPALVFDVMEADGDARLLRLRPALARSGSLIVAEETVPGSVLPAGRYRLVVRASEAGEPMMSRRFVVEPGPARRRGLELRSPTAGSDEAATVAAASGLGGAGLAAFSVLALARPAPFDPRVVLDRPFVAPVFERLAARPDAAAVRDRLVALAPESWPADATSGPLAASPVAAHLVAGLARMRTNDFEGAAADFRSALRMAPDFTPALFLLGACYASGGKDREAASAWQTGLLRDRDTPAVYRFAIEAWLRAEGAPAALLLARQARAQWPAEAGLSRLHALAAFAAGEVQEGIQLVTAMGESVDEPLVLMALASLYAAGREAAPAWNADRDLPVMRALRGRYAARAGRSLALVDAWIADLGKR